MQKLLKHFRANKWFYLIFFGLLIVPLFWFKPHLYILGEDDSGLTYYNTWALFQESLSSWFSADHIGRFEESAGHLTVFTLVLLFLKTVTFHLINVQLLIYGLLMSLSFLYLVKILELLTQKKSPIYFLAGLFYVLSPYFIIIEYYYLMPSTFAILLAPAIMFYLLQALYQQKWKWLLPGALWSLVLSRVLITPTFLNFFVLLFIFILVLGFFDQRLTIKRAFFYFIFYAILIALINAMIIIPLLFSLTEKGSSAIQQTITDRNIPSYIDNMIGYIKIEIGLNRVSYYLRNIFPEPISLLQGARDYDFYPHYLNKTGLLMYVITLSTFAGILLAIKKRNKIITPILILFLISLMFLNVNFLSLTENFYYFLMYHTPIFNMNRVPSMKFHIPYIFYYSLLVGIGIDYLYASLNLKYKKVLIFILLCVMLANGFILITGKVFTESLSPAYTVRAMNFNQDYLQLTKDFPKVIKDDSNLLLFPLGYGFGGFIVGEDSTQFYRAPITGFKSFTGHNMYGNIRILGSVIDPTIYSSAVNFYFKHNVQDILNLSQKLNIKYVVFTKDFERLRKFAEIIPEFTYESKYYFAPVNTKQTVYENKGYKIYKIKTYDTISHFTTQNKESELYFQKASDFMYLIKIKTADVDTLVMNEGYSNKWELHKITASDFECSHPKNYAKNYPQIFECDHPNNNLEGNMKFFSLWNSPLYQAKHNLYKKFGNSWTINPTEDYTYLAVVFTGQKYFLIGIGLSTLCTILYILIFIFYERQKKSITE